MKKIMAMLLALLMLVTLFAGCAKTQPAAPQQEKTDAPSNTETSAAADSSFPVDTLIIGHYNPLTGANATSGQAGRDGAQLAVKLWNEKGGVNGAKIEYIVYDDQSTTEGAVKACTRLIEEDGVHGLIGSQLSGNIQATGQMVEDAGIPEVGTGISTVWPQPEWTYLFRALANNDGGTQPLVDTMTEIGITSIAAIIYQDEGSRGSWSKMIPVLETANIAVTDEETFQPGDTDWTGQIGAMLNTNPDALAVIAQGEQQGNLLKQIRAMGFSGYVFGVETSTLPDIRKVAGDAADGQVFYAPYCIPDSIEDATSEDEKAFLEAYVAEYGQMPASDVAYRCFDAMNILLTGFERANSVDGETVRDAIYGITDLKTLGGTANFAETHDGECMKGFQIYITHNGKNILWNTFKEANDVDLYFKK